MTKHPVRLEDAFAVVLVVIFVIMMAVMIYIGWFQR